MTGDELEGSEEHDPVSRVDAVPDVEERMGASEHQQVKSVEPVLGISPFQGGRFESLVDDAKSSGVLLGQADTLG
jgi:hypothetical protein